MDGCNESLHNIHDGVGVEGGVHEYIGGGAGRYGDMFDMVQGVNSGTGRQGDAGAGAFVGGHILCFVGMVPRTDVVFAEVGVLVGVGNIELVEKEEEEVARFNLGLKDKASIPELSGGHARREKLRWGCW